jgi:hypothetical protein
MADNFPFTPGVGATGAADDVGGVLYQKIKIDVGGDGASIPVVGTADFGIPVDIKRSVAQTVSITGGSIASGDADSGNPVKIGGVYNSSPISLVSGERGDIQLTTEGYIKVNIASGLSAPVADKSAFTIGTSTGSPLFGLHQSSVDTLSNATVAALALDPHRNLQVNIATAIKGEDQTNDLIGVMIKPGVVSTYSFSNYTDLASLVTKATPKAFPGNVMSFDVTNDNAAVRYFQLHNKATAPAGTNVPVKSWKIPAGTANNPGRLTLDTKYFGANGYYLSTGVSWAISTTHATFTDSATASEHNVDFNYI